MDIRKNFFTVRRMRHWNRLPRKLVNAPALQLLKLNGLGKMPLLMAEGLELGILGAIQAKP